MGSKITIELPDSVEDEHRVLTFLRSNGIKVRKEEPSNDQGAPDRDARWVKAAQRLRSEGYLRGHGDEVKKLQREFRDSFSF